MANQIISVSDARKKLPFLVDSSDETGAKFTITKHGEPAAILLSVSEFEEMVETIEVLGDKELMKQIMAFEQSEGSVETQSVDELMTGLMKEFDKTT